MCGKLHCQVIFMNASLIALASSYLLFLKKNLKYLFYSCGGFCITTKTLQKFSIV